MTTVGEAMEREYLYTERARCAIAIARGCRRMGLRVGIAVDPKDPDWPVLFVDLPTGQCSWHLSPLSRRDLAGDIQDDPTWIWDGHTTEEKYRRLDEWSRSLAP